MTDKMLEAIGKAFPLTLKDDGGLIVCKANGMKFTIRSFDAKGLGCVSVMKGSAVLGLMKMDTVIVNPFERDMALFSYDRIYAMGNDTVFLEMYDTRLDRTKTPDAAAKVAEGYADIPEQPVAPNWYDDIKLPGCLKKKGKKALTPRFDELTEKYLEAYLTLCKDAGACDRDEKMKAAQVYTEGLLTNGGPSTDQFIKAKGREFTEKLFRETLFGTGDPER